MTLLRDKEKRTKLRSELYSRLSAGGVPLAEAVQTLRKIVAKDQASFSSEVGVSLSVLRKIEQQGGNFTWAIAERILAKFNLELVVVTKRRANISKSDE